jgi:hypothetical protein
VPLSSYGQPYTPPAGTVDPAIDMKTAVREQVHALDGAAYFARFAELLKTNPPAAEDAPMLAKLAKLGIVPGQDFDAAKLPPAVAKGIADAPAPAQKAIMDWMKEGIVARDMKPSTAGSSPRRRASTARRIASAAHHRDRARANRPQDAVYPTSRARTSSPSTAARRSTSCTSRRTSSRP